MPLECFLDAQARTSSNNIARLRSVLLARGAKPGTQIRFPPPRCSYLKGARCVLLAVVLGARPFEKVHPPHHSEKGPAESALATDVETVLIRCVEQECDCWP